MSDTEWQDRTNIDAVVKNARNANEKARRRYPYAEERQHARGLLTWLRGDKVLVWIVALLLSHAIARLVNAVMETVVEPTFNCAFGDPDNENPETTILGAKIKLRQFIVAIVQFVLLVAIAYALSGSGRRDPGYYRTVEGPAR